MKLYELAGSYSQLMEMVENGEIEFDAIKDTLESINDSMEIKVENIVKLMKSIEGNIEVFKAEEKRIKERRVTMEKRLENLKGYLFSVLKANKITKVNAGTFTVGIQKSQASVNIINEKIVPKKYRIPQPDKVDKAAIAKDLKDGISIKGATLIDNNEHLRIR